MFGGFLRVARSGHKGEFNKMKRAWVWVFVAGLLFGGALGFWMSPKLCRVAAPTGTAFLRGFTLPPVPGRTGQTNWLVLEDRVYEPFPSLARAKRVARRIVAQTEMSDEEVGLFATRFPQVVRETLDTHQARNEAQFELTRDATRVVDGAPVRSRVDFPRRYYALGDVHGVADCWYVSESGRVTVMVSLIEGP